MIPFVSRKIGAVVPGSRGLLRWQCEKNSKPSPEATDVVGRSRSGSFPMISVSPPSTDSSTTGGTLISLDF